MFQQLHTHILEMTAAAQDLHRSERRLTLKSIELVAVLEAQKAWYLLGMSVESFARHIGLSPSQYWKRAKVARLIQRFPQAGEMFARGETEFSHLVLIAGKITEANAKILLSAIRGTSRREAEAFVSRVTCDGQVLDVEGSLDFNARLKESEYALLERAREILAHGGHVPGNAEILAEALDALLEKKDPLRKADRAQKRRDKVPMAKPEDFSWTDPAIQDSVRTVDAVPNETDDGSIGAKQSSETVETDQDQNPRTAPGQYQRTPIPASLRHAIWLRDQGRCTYRNPDGSRCEQRMMLEIDHEQMVCRGGTNEPKNLRLRCRFHNRFSAELNLGQTFMEKFRRSS